MLSGRGLCDELITRPEESYRLCCVVLRDLETSRMGDPYTYDLSRLRVKCLLSSGQFCGENSVALKKGKRLSLQGVVLNTTVIKPTIVITGHTSAHLWNVYNITV